MSGLDRLAAALADRYRIEPEVSWSMPRVQALLKTSDPPQPVPLN